MSTDIPSVSLHAPGQMPTPSAQQMAAPTPAADKPAAPEAAAPEFDPQVSKETLQAAVDQLNQQLQRNNRDLAFSVDQVVDRTVISVRDREGQLVRQIPSEAWIRVAHDIEHMKGLLQDQTI